MSDQQLLYLLKRDAYKKGKFTISSGKTSEHYINCKPVVLNGRGLTLASFALLEYIDTQVVAGLTLGAEPLVSGVAFASAVDTALDIPIIDALIVRKEPKGHGTQAWIEGPQVKKGIKITVLEDVVTTGGSAIKAAEKLRDAGYIVEKVVAIVDREEGGESAMKEAGLELESLYVLEDIVNYNLTL